MTIALDLEKTFAAMLNISAGDRAPSKKRDSRGFHSQQTPLPPASPQQNLFHITQLVSYVDSVVAITGAIMLFSVMSIGGVAANLLYWVITLCLSNIVYSAYLSRRHPDNQSNETLKTWSQQHDIWRAITGLIWAYPLLLLSQQTELLYQLTILTTASLLLAINSLTSLSIKRFALTSIPGLVAVCYGAIALNSTTVWLGTIILCGFAALSTGLAFLIEKGTRQFVEAKSNAHAYLHDVETERDKLRQVTAALDQSEELLNLVANNASDIIILHDSDGRYLYMNDAIERVLGYPAHSMLGKDPLDFIHPDDLTIANNDLREPGLSGQPVMPTRYRFQHSKGHYVWLDTAIRSIEGNDGSIRVVSVSRDISDKITMEEDLHKRATTDAITGVLNRATFDELLHDAVKAVAQKDRSHALIYIDLDQFKIINDTSGHTAGDKMLHAVAELLSEHVRGDDALARMGGDEFALLMYDCNHAVALERCEELRQSLAESRFSISDRYYSMAASFGLVMLNDEISSGATALQHADVACYVAKNHGRNAIHVWHHGDEIASKHLRAMDWVTTLQTAVEHDQVELHAQAICPLNDTDKSRHYEVLCTLRNQQGDVVSPSDFVPAAEYFGLASLLDYHIVETTFKALAKNKKYNREGNWLSINLSADTVCNHGALNKLKSLFKKYKIDPNYICFEVTETATLRSVEGATELLLGLKKLGCKISLDDFGSGFSSFEHLTHLPIDIVKIDGQFVQDFASNPASQAIVQGIFGAAQALGIKTIAEWVEDEATSITLAEMGVEYGQGFHLAQRQPLVEALQS